MLFSLPPPMDSASVSAILSQLSGVTHAAIHWTAPREYLASDNPSEIKITYLINGPTRALTQTEGELVWQALFDSGETLYSL